MRFACRSFLPVCRLLSGFPAAEWGETVVQGPFRALRWAAISGPADAFGDGANFGTDRLAGTPDIADMFGMNGDFAHNPTSFEHSHPLFYSRFYRSMFGKQERKSR